MNIPHHATIQQIFDVCYLTWYVDINNSSRLQSYCIFKHNFTMEKYLHVIKEKIMIVLSNFRTCSHRLYIETHRYDITARSQRLCQSCNLRIIEDVFHFLLVYPQYREVRWNYFRPYFFHWPTLKRCKCSYRPHAIELFIIYQYACFALQLRK